MDKRQGCGGAAQLAAGRPPAPREALTDPNLPEGLQEASPIAEPSISLQTDLRCAVPSVLSRQGARRCQEPDHHWVGHVPRGYGSHSAVCVLKPWYVADSSKLLI